MLCMEKSLLLSLWMVDRIKSLLTVGLLSPVLCLLSARTVLRSQRPLRFSHVAPVPQRGSLPLSVTIQEPYVRCQDGGLSSLLSILYISNRKEIDNSREGLASVFGGDSPGISQCSSVTFYSDTFVLVEHWGVTYGRNTI